MAEAPPPVEDQARLLEDALSIVRQQAVMMRKCLETPGKLMDALKCRYGGRHSSIAAPAVTSFDLVTNCSIVLPLSQNYEPAV